MVVAIMLMNEITHVYQKTDGTFAGQCDADRDSDVLTKKLALRLLRYSNGRSFWFRVRAGFRRSGALRRRLVH